jgi:hypothetical protein
MKVLRNGIIAQLIRCAIDFLLDFILRFQLCLGDLETLSLKDLRWMGCGAGSSSCSSDSFG